MGTSFPIARAEAAKPDRVAQTMFEADDDAGGEERLERLWLGVFGLAQIRDHRAA